MAIPGLKYYPEIMSAEMEKMLISEIDSKDWSTKLSRRTQHYGYVYDYKSSNVLEKAEEFPKLINALADYLVLNKIFEIKPNQCIVNEYMRNQGISPHIDKNIFGNTIVSISLNADTIMNFTLDKNIPVFLPRRSMIVLQGEARNLFKHSIDAKVNYTHNDVKITKPKDYRRDQSLFAIIN